MTPPLCRHYDTPFLNPKLSDSLANNISECARKAQIFEQAQLHLRVQRQAARRAELLSYARENYTEAAIAAGAE